MTPLRIPATIVTGFLGAGKTTLIRNLILDARGRRIAVIVNEFGDMGFDGSLIADCGDDDCRPDTIVELTNGCIWGMAGLTMVLSRAPSSIASKTPPRTSSFRFWGRSRMIIKRFS